MKELGAARLNFQGLNTYGLPQRARLKNGIRLVDNALNSLSADEIDRVTKEIQDLSTDTMPVAIVSDLGGRGSQHLPQDGVVTCRELWDSPFIDSAGRVTPCCWIPDGCIMTLGDLKTSTFSEIWKGQEYIELRRLHLTNQHPKQCKGCQALSLPADDLEHVLRKEPLFIRVRRHHLVRRIVPASVRFRLRGWLSHAR